MLLCFTVDIFVVGIELFISNHSIHHNLQICHTVGKNSFMGKRVDHFLQVELHLSLTHHHLTQLTQLGCLILILILVQHALHKVQQVAEFPLLHAGTEFLQHLPQDEMFQLVELFGLVLLAQHIGD